MTILSEAIRVARKRHRCDAFHWIMQFYEDGVFSYGELRAIARMRRQGGMIASGQPYLRQVAIVEGDFCVYKANPELHAICIHHDLFDE